MKAAPGEAAAHWQRARQAPGRLSVVALYVSPGHNYFGRHGGPPGDHPLQRSERIRCLAGRGLEGDRFLDYREDYRGQITFFSLEVYEELCEKLDVRDRHPGVFRRNVITRGGDLSGYIGRDFKLQGVPFRGTAECSPCYWMDQAFGPGAEALLEGRGGLRAKILSDGILRVDGNG